MKKRVASIIMGLVIVLFISILSAQAALRIRSKSQEGRPAQTPTETQAQPVCAQQDIDLAAQYENACHHRISCEKARRLSQRVQNAINKCSARERK